MSFENSRTIEILESTLLHAAANVEKSDSPEIKAGLALLLQLEIGKCVPSPVPQSLRQTFKIFLSLCLSPEAMAAYVILAEAFTSDTNDLKAGKSLHGPI